MSPRKTRRKRPGYSESEPPNFWEDAWMSPVTPSGEQALRLQARLRELQALLAAGLISVEEYKTLRKEALAQEEV